MRIRSTSVHAFLLVSLAHLLLGLYATCADAQESTEASRVASWVRDLPPVAPDSSHFAVIGGLSTVHIGGTAMRQVREGGPASLYENGQALDQARRTIETRADSYVRSLRSGGLGWFRDVQNLPWGMIETRPGRYDFDLSDQVVRSLEAHDARYVGTVMPYAGWELRAAGYAPTTDDMCSRLLQEDFFYLDFDGRMDRFRDRDSWLRFLAALVERYDGDGIDDMPGLRVGIEYWQIHNEPEGERCGGFRNDVAGFVELMRDAWTVIHRSCASCKVLQGGAGIPLWREGEIAGSTFWREFAELGGAPWVDVIAVHYNHGKVDGGSIEDFETQVGRMRELLGEKPVHVTEFGVFVDFGGQFTALPERDAAAWYMRFYAAGLAAGVERFFSDAPAFVRFPDGTILLPFYVNKLLEAKIGDFTAAMKLGDGQYRFLVEGRDRYIIWRDVPSEISGRVLVTDLLGHESVMDASDVAASESNPLILSPVSKRRRSVRR